MKAIRFLIALVCSLLVLTSSIRTTRLKQRREMKRTYAPVRVVQRLKGDLGSLRERRGYESLDTRHESASMRKSRYRGRY